MNDSDFVTAFAPASIGNVGVGFDMLGLAIAGAGDRVSVRKTDSGIIKIREVRGPDGAVHPGLSANTEENTASIAAKSLWEEGGDNAGLELIVHKGVPLRSGMGSSAASAVAAVAAVNALLEKPMPVDDLLIHALAGEAFASGGLHADNVAPSLVGGLVLCPQALTPTIVRLPVPEGVSSVLIHPELQIDTADSRKTLAASYSMDQWLTQQGYLAGFVAACAGGNIDLLGDCLRDELIEPQRAASVPCFAAVKDAAISSGALGCSLSGSGPSIFALCRDDDAELIRTAMVTTCEAAGYEYQTYVSPLGAPGAVVESSQ